MNTTVFHGSIRERNEDGSHRNAVGKSELFVLHEGRIYPLAPSLSTPAIPANWIKPEMPTSIHCGPWSVMLKKEKELYQSWGGACGVVATKRWIEGDIEIPPDIFRLIANDLIGAEITVRLIANRTSKSTVFRAIINTQREEVRLDDLPNRSGIQFVSSGQVDLGFGMMPNEWEYGEQCEIIFQSIACVPKRATKPAADCCRL